MHIFKPALVAATLLGAFHVATAQQWFTSQSGSLLQFNYGTASNAPQYGVLDLSSSYFRMNYGPTSGWGTSVDTMPSYWSGGTLYQGYGVSASTQTNGADLVLTVDGASNGLTIHETITVAPPSNGSIAANVAASVTGSVTLDGNRPGEAFKPVFLSSMHDSSTSWDASAPFVGSQTYGFPNSGWIIPPSPVVAGTQFGLLGGTSNWKTNAPTVTITFPTQEQVAGWLTSDSNPNDDNVGFWAATTTVLPSWNYQVLVNSATSPAPEPCSMAALGLGVVGLIRLRRRR
jgi:MYXO-CTERM domain-containing protein